MNLDSLRESVQSRGFALMDFCIVAISGAVLCLFPDFWFWSLLIALIPCGFRAVAGVAPFKRTGFDWLILVFIVTAGAGYWASYDKTIASTKFFLILAAVLLFYALSSQPKENWAWISVVLFCIGVGVSVYFFLTHDFLASPRKFEFVNVIGLWMTQVRPALGWGPIHPNYVSGIAAVATPFILYPLWKFSSSSNHGFLLIIAIGLGVVFSAMVMGTSRGVLMAMTSAVGVWVLWRVISLNKIKLRLGKEAVFPSLVLLYLTAIIIFLYLGPATSGADIKKYDRYGSGSRAELVARSLYLVADFPFTGGGLGTFPALYSHYLLGIPHYNVPNAHNTFLDVFIEQGIFGGLAFFALYIVSIWHVARAVSSASSAEMKIFGWSLLIALVIAFVHAMVDDYLYHGDGTILSLVLVGISISFSRSEPVTKKKRVSLSRMIYLGAGIVSMSLFFLNLNRIQSAWYANIGAVQMAQVELAGFPTDEWAEPEIVTQLDSADVSLRSSLELDPANRTANHRLGLIALLRRDFSSAEGYLERAYAQTPGHRGITKALGYCYVWLGELDKASSLLNAIPEAQRELDVYVWWWQAQGLSEVSNYALLMHSRLADSSLQP